FPRPFLPAALAPDLLPPPARPFISPASRVTLSAVPPGRRKQGDYGHGRRLLARGQVVHRGAEAAGPDGPCFLAGFDRVRWRSRYSRPGAGPRPALRPRRAEREEYDDGADAGC